MNTQVNTPATNDAPLPTFVHIPVITKTLTELEEQQKKIKAAMTEAKRSMATRNEAFIYNKDASVGRAIRLAMTVEAEPVKAGEPPRKQVFTPMFVHIHAELVKLEAADALKRGEAVAIRTAKNATAKVKSDATKAAKKAALTPVAVKPATTAPITTKFTPNPVPAKI